MRDFSLPNNLQLDLQKGHVSRIPDPKPRQSGGNLVPVVSDGSITPAGVKPKLPTNRVLPAAVPSSSQHNSQVLIQSMNRNKGFLWHDGSRRNTRALFTQEMKKHGRTWKQQHDWYVRYLKRYNKTIQPDGFELSTTVEVYPPKVKPMPKPLHPLDQHNSFVLKNAYEQNQGIIWHDGKVYPSIRLTFAGQMKKHGRTFDEQLKWYISYLRSQRKRVMPYQATAPSKLLTAGQGLDKRNIQILWLAYALDKGIVWHNGQGYPSIRLTFDGQMKKHGRTVQQQFDWYIQHLSKQKKAIKALGFDPTAPHIHLGNKAYADPKDRWNALVIRTAINERKAFIDPLSQKPVEAYKQFVDGMLENRLTAQQLLDVYLGKIRAAATTAIPVGFTVSASPNTNSGTKQPPLTDSTPKTPEEAIVVKQSEEDLKQLEQAAQTGNPPKKKDNTLRNSMLTVAAGALVKMAISKMSSGGDGLSGIGKETFTIQVKNQ